jgi:hypothetical protein
MPRDVSGPTAYGGIPSKIVRMVGTKRKRAMTYRRITYFIVRLRERAGTDDSQTVTDSQEVRSDSQTASSSAPKHLYVGTIWIFKLNSYVRT